MGNRLRVAAVQMTSGSDAPVNLAQATALVDHAIGLGATYIQLPEYAAFYGTRGQYAEGAQRLRGPFVSAMTDIAQANNVTIHIGSLLEHHGTSRYTNTSVVVAPNGGRSVYRKMHLFDVDVPNAITYHESAEIDAGTELVIATVGEAHFGLSICFDLRFPELFRALSVAGATVLAVPSAFSAATGPAHFEVLLRARAIENGAFVVAATQVGVTREGLATYGHASIMSPWGDVLAQAGGEGPEVIVADLDLDQVVAQRAQINTLGLRRASLYNGAIRRDVLA